MIILPVLNTLAIISIFLKLKIIDISIRRDETFWNKTLMGYNVWVNNFYFRIPIRNKRKTEIKEKVNRMISKNSKQNNLQKLHAIFSWLKTWEEVNQFKKDYYVVDKDIVDDLVSKFVPKK